MYLTIAKWSIGCVALKDEEARREDLCEGWVANVSGGLFRSSFPSSLLFQNWIHACPESRECRRLEQKLEESLKKGDRAEAEFVRGRCFRKKSLFDSKRCKDDFAQSLFWTLTDWEMDMKSCCWETQSFRPERRFQRACGRIASIISFKLPGRFTPSLLSGLPPFFFAHPIDGCGSPKKGRQWAILGGSWRKAVDFITTYFGIWRTLLTTLPSRWVTWMICCEIFMPNHWWIASCCCCCLQILWNQSARFATTHLGTWVTWVRARIRSLAPLLLEESQQHSLPIDFFALCSLQLAARYKETSFSSTPNWNIPREYYKQSHFLAPLEGDIFFSFSQLFLSSPMIASSHR